MDNGFLLFFCQFYELGCAALRVGDIGYDKIRLFQHPFIAEGDGEAFGYVLNAIGQEGFIGEIRLFCGEIGKHHRIADLGIGLCQFLQSGTYKGIKSPMIAHIKGVDGMVFY